MQISSVLEKHRARHFGVQYALDSYLTAVQGIMNRGSTANSKYQSFEAVALNAYKFQFPVFG